MVAGEPTDRPSVESPSPGVVLVRYDLPHHLAPELQGEMLEVVRAASACGPVGLVFAIGRLIREIAPEVRVFWRRVVTDPSLRVSALAVVTESWAVAVAAEGFGVTNQLDGAPVKVATFEDEREGVLWAERTRARIRVTPFRIPALPKRRAGA